LTAARQISSVSVVHPTLHTAGTHAGISIDMRSQSKIFAAELFSFGRNLFTASEMICHLHPFYHRGLWISIDAYALDLHFRLQKTDTI
jgi:hypothetical protein